MKFIKKLFRYIFPYVELKYLAYHDTLTGLYNRNWLYKKIKPKDYLYVYFIDINGLSIVNQKGHTFGDKHIKKCVSDIYNRIKFTDCFIRYAGDEFIIFAKNVRYLKTNKLYSVGFSEIKDNDLSTAINTADYNMIKEKRIWYMHN